MRLTELRVKFKTLASESKIIRLEEERLKCKYTWEPDQKRLDRQGNPCLKKTIKWRPNETLERRRNTLHDHRVHEVRKETRHSLLAYGFLRGVPYRTMEQKVREDNEPNLEEVQSIAERFGGKTIDNKKTEDLLKEWYAA